MRIWLARHAEAVSPDEVATDFERRLSHHGRKQIAHLGRWLKDREELPDAILYSPLCRARETAEILREELHAPIRCQESQLLSPGMRCEKLLAHLSQGTDEIVVCVGHQPDISRCLSEMVGGGRFVISPGTIAGVEFRQLIIPGAGELRWLITPDWFQ